MTEDDSLVLKITESIQNKAKGTFLWINTSEGKIISKTVASLASYVVGDPTGMLFPTILECADYTIRKRFTKHIPDLVQKLEENKSNLNKKFIKSEFAQTLLRETIKEIVNETDEEKIKSLKQFLVSTYVQKDPKEAVLTDYRKILLGMDGRHIQILSVLSNPQKICLDIIKKTLSESKDSFKIVENYNQFLKMNNTLFTKSIRDLSNWSILLPEYKESQHRIVDPPDPDKLAKTKKPSYRRQHVQKFAMSYWKYDHVILKKN